MKERIERVIDYIDKNLSKDLSLDNLSEVGCLSKYHFSRIFSIYTGFGPSRFIRTKRLAEAERLLLASDLSIQEIAESVGFGSISNFNTTFKAGNGVSPRQFRSQGKSKNQIEPSKSKKDLIATIFNNQEISDFHRRIIDMDTREAILKEMRVAYTTQKCSYLETGKLWQLLMNWAIPNRLFPPACQYFGISYDEPDAPDDLKTYDACVVLPDGFESTDDKVLFKTVKGGLFLMYSFYDKVQRLGLVYKQVVTEYLPGSKYELDERDFLEFVMNDVSQDPEGKVRIDLYIPVRMS